MGAGPPRTAHAVVREAARELLAEGTYRSLARGLDHGELSSLFAQ
ncbi:hypothetical protein ACFVXC_01855 [Streptomyces sp. NPDC058257]